MVAIAKPTKAERAAQARRDYIENTRPVMIDMDGDKPYAVVPSQDGSRTYKVFFVEPRGEVPHAASCQCKLEDRRAIWKNRKMISTTITTRKPV